MLQVLAGIERDYSTLQAPLEFPQHVATDKALRDASTEAARQLDEFDVEMRYLRGLSIFVDWNEFIDFLYMYSMRKDVFDKVQVFKQNGHLDRLEPEAKRYIERLIKVGMRNG